MKTEVNRNYLTAQIFVDSLIESGLEYAVISPGSRNTPLTFAFAERKEIKCISVIDERSAGFFALGIAQSTGNPAAVVTTSGTASVEVYPAVTEAYMSRIPMIVCTADRPVYLRNTGANQTINQNNLYQNHIRRFNEIGLPVCSFDFLENVKLTAFDSFLTADYLDKGPVHINFCFEKPLEPGAFTDTIDEELLLELNKIIYSPGTQLKDTKPSEEFCKKLAGSSKCLIFAGGRLTGKECSSILKLSEHLSAPVLADAASPLRFSDNNNVIKAFPGYINKTEFKKYFSPELILSFGKAPTSNSTLSFLEYTAAEKYAVNPYLDSNDPSRTTKEIFDSSVERFCSRLINETAEKPGTVFLDAVKKTDSQVNILLDNEQQNSQKNFEGRIIKEVLDNLPQGSEIFISNSMPVRDLDMYCGHNKLFRTFFNRGASGIDGILSTSAGINFTSGKPLYLITGDLAFHYDSNTLQLISELKLDLRIILINNSGGGIFRMLPASDGSPEFEKYIIARHNLNFEKIAGAYGIKHFSGYFDPSVKGPAVFEFLTDSQYSSGRRKEINEKIKLELQSISNDN